ncbi:hypothetical protein AB0P21_07040 [Kribbella sp. NPDC056861]|uniref:hypothetical protein n=1 Tax=Kribbella sp. NPDC056861 TaxID=3154857 RepID=UPI00343490FE
MATEQGDQFAAWLSPQLDPASEPASEPAQDQPGTPKPDLSQGSHGVSAAAPADGVSAFADMLAEILPSPLGDGWYDVHDVRTGGPYNEQFKSL